MTSQTIVVPTIYAGAIGGDKAFTLTLSNVTLSGSDGGAIAVLGAGPQTVATLPTVVTVKDANTSSTSHVFLMGNGTTSTTAVPADDAETIETSGAYTSTSTTHYFDVGGVYDPSSNPEYGALDFNDPTNSQSGATFTPVNNITAINSIALTFNQTNTNTSPSSELGTDGESGYLDVYLVSDDTSSIDGVSSPVAPPGEPGNTTTPYKTTTANITANGDYEYYDKTQTYPTAGFGATR